MDIEPSFETNAYLSKARRAKSAPFGIVSSALPPRVQ